MQNFNQAEPKNSNVKIIITVVIVVLVVLGAGYFLFKISPQQQAATTGGYNALLDASGAKQISTPPPFNPAADHYQGSAAAKNTFIEYGDMECPACAAYSDILKAVPTTFKDTVFVFRYFPLVQIHPNSVEAALAVEAAGAQGKYWEMHDLLFKNQADWESLSDPIDNFVQYAQSVGVANIDQFKSDITSKKYLPAIETDNNEAIGLSLPGTPSFFFNGHALTTGQDVAGMEKQAEQYYVK
jgi:protein-disulfide isomerase